MRDGDEAKIKKQPNKATSRRFKLINTTVKSNKEFLKKSGFLKNLTSTTVIRLIQDNCFAYKTKKIINQSIQGKKEKNAQQHRKQRREPNKNKLILAIIN